MAVLASLIMLPVGHLTGNTLLMVFGWACVCLVTLAGYAATFIASAWGRRHWDSFNELRRSLRRGLHDGLGPKITTASMRIETARSLLQQDPSAADALLVQAYTEIRDVVAEMRELIGGLHTNCGPRQETLAHSLRELAARFERASGHELKIRVECPQQIQRITPALAEAAYFIVSEALTNVAKHAQATRSRVRVAPFNLGIMISVTDNGIGFPETAAPGVGMTSMLERASELNGSCSIGRGSSGGTEVRAFLPHQGFIFGIQQTKLNAESTGERRAN